MTTKTKRGAGSRSSGRGGASRKRSASTRTPVRTHLAPWARDAFGIFLVVFALLSVLSLWFDAAGSAGRVIEWLLKGGFGIAAIAFPVIGVYWGVVLLRGTADEDRVRMFIGFAIATAGILGILSIANGNPAPLDGWDGGRAQGLAEAGGLVGALVGWPLGTALSLLGGGIVCAGLIVLGALIFSGTPLSSVWVRTKEFVGEGTLSRAFGLGDDDAGDDQEPIAERGRRVLRSDEEEPSGPTIVVPEAEAEPSDAAASPAPAKIPLPSDELDDQSPAPVAPTVAAAASRRAAQGDYKLPPLDLLRTAPAKEADTSDEEHTMDALERTFQTFGVEATVPTAHRGPTVTLYEVEVGAGTKVNKVLNLADDIAYALATPDVRIIAPIPGKSAIGVEVPNKVRDFVTLGDILRSKAARDETLQLSVALGKDVHGRAQMVDLAKMPHVLIAGATGAGKSSLINSFVTSILMRTDPDRVKLVLIDPKRVELSHFADLPHLLSPVIVHPSERRRHSDGSFARWRIVTSCWPCAASATSTGIGRASRTARCGSRPARSRNSSSSRTWWS